MFETIAFFSLLSSAAGASIMAPTLKNDPISFSSSIQYVSASNTLLDFTLSGDKLSLLSLKGTQRAIIPFDVNKYGNYDISYHSPIYYPNFVILPLIGPFGAIVDNQTGAVRAAVNEPQGLQGRRFEFVQQLDKDGNRLCYLSQNYVGVLDIKTQKWVSFKELTKSVFTPSYWQAQLPITSDGQSVVFMTAPKTLDDKDPYEIDRVNCYNPEIHAKLGEVPELAAPAGDTGTVSVEIRYQAIQVNTNSFVISKSAAVYTGSPAIFAKVEISATAAKTVSSFRDDKFEAVYLLAYNQVKNRIYAFGQRYLGPAKDNLVIDVAHMTASHGATYPSGVPLSIRDADATVLSNGDLIKVQFDSSGVLTKSFIFKTDSETFE